MVASVGVLDPNIAPESSVQSSTSLKNLSSKIVKGLGQVCPQKTGPSSSAETHAGGGGGAGMAGGMGFGGSMLGEVLVSYSTSSLPPAKRHSISATSAHYEELAAEAGIDLDADEINIEDLRMYRMEDESGYALGGGGDSDNTDDDDGNDDAENNLLDSNYHIKPGSNATTSANQKLAHKERSILQMVGVLSDRLTSLNAVVINRYNGCKSDLDEATEFRSSRTKKMAVIAEEDWSSATPRKGAEKAKQRSTMFNGGEGADGNEAVGLSRMTFRNAPQTDAGRKLAHQFEQEYGLKQASSSTPKFNKTTSGKLKRVDHYKKNESRKHERLHFERKLQSNLDQYVTRAVTELVYRMPGDVADVSDEDDEHAERRDHRGEGGSQDGTLPPVAQINTSAPGGPHGDGTHRTPGQAALVDVMERERFPIPMESNEMNPKLLLSYACERTVLPGGARMFKHFATSLESQHLFVYIFWFVHCKFFQEESRQEQAHLLRSASSRYVGVLGTEGMEDYKDFFFKHYPFVVANAVIWGFHYLCPGSRHLYSSAFKRVVYLQCARILSGIEVTPSSTTEMRTKLFPDEIAEALDELEYHPHHVHAPGTRTTAGAGGSVGLGLGVATAVAAAASVGGGSGQPLPTTSVGPAASESASGAGKSGGKHSALPGVVETAGQDNGAAAAGVLDNGKRDGGGGVGKSEMVEAAGEVGGRTKGLEGGEGTMIQRMNKTFRPDPLGAYTGDRNTLRFKPKRQEGLTTLRPRQQRTIFDAAQISPMLQEYLRQSSSTGGRRSENIVRTVPVPWCQSGGSDTYRRHPSRKELHDAMNSEHAKAKREFARGRAQAAKALRRTLRKVDVDRHTIFRKGPRQVGLKSMDIVTELQQQGAFKGFKRSNR